MDIFFANSHTRSESLIAISIYFGVNDRVKAPFLGNRVDSCIETS